MNRSQQAKFLSIKGMAKSNVLFDPRERAGWLCEICKAM